MLLTNTIHSLNRYSYGKKVNGGFHCRFGVRGENTNGANDITFIKGLEETGPVSENVFTILNKIKEQGIYTQNISYWPVFLAFR